jgi:hypothetical protein
VKSPASTTDLDRLTKIKGSLRHLVKNYTVGNPGAQAACTSAAHVEKPPKKEDPNTTHTKKTPAPTGFFSIA